ncbi:MAG: M23 family metallopeptidase [Bacteroidota bacterium]
MEKLKKLFIILLLSLLSNSFLLAQKNVVAIDTIDLNTNKVILYSDNTWSYLMSSDNSLTRQDSLNFINSNWEMVQIFAYLNERGKDGTYEFDKSSMSKELLTVPIHGTIYGGFHKGHDGVDIALNKGDKIYAAMDGKVRYAQFQPHGYGNLIIIRHYNGLETWYSHLEKIHVKPNQFVKSGDVIGTGGRTGRASANHLHFETRYHDKPMNPEMFFDFNKSNLVSNERIKSLPDTLSKSIAKNIEAKKEVASKKESQKKTNTKKKTHTIKSGDTLSKLARDYHTSVDDICKANKISKDGVLSLGQKVVIPTK